MYVCDTVLFYPAMIRPPSPDQRDPSTDVTSDDRDIPPEEVDAATATALDSGRAPQG